MAKGKYTMPIHDYVYKMNFVKTKNKTYSFGKKHFLEFEQI